MKYFFAIGRIVFLIVAIANIFTVYFYWGNTIISSKVSGIAMTFFYFMLVLVFNQNYKNLKDTPNISEKEVDEAIKEFE